MHAASDHVRLGPLGQVAVTVEDVGRATAFYRDMLGLAHLFDAPGLAFFDLGGTRLMLAARAEGRPAGNGSTVLYYRVDDIGAAHDALRGRGVHFVRPPHLIVRMPDHELWMAFLEDGEGNLAALMAEV